MQSKEFKLRRDEFLQQIGGSSIAIVFAAKECIRSGTECYPYRQHSDFYYLTGFTEPEAIAVFIPGRKAGEFVLFNREHNAIAELWYGCCVGQEGACYEFGADQAFPITAVDAVLPQLLIGRKYIYCNADSDRDLSLKIDFWINQGKLSIRDDVGVAYKLINIGGFL